MIKIKMYRSGKIMITAPNKTHQDIISRMQRSMVRDCISKCLVAFSDTKVARRKK